MRKVPEDITVAAAAFRSIGDISQWANSLQRALSAFARGAGYRVNRVLPLDGTEPMQAPLPLEPLLTANLPAAADWTGAIVYVSDGATPGLYQSNGVTWVAIYTPSLTGYVPTSRHVDTQYSLTGGGDLTANRTLNLVNDAASPGANVRYATDASGTRGWLPDPQPNVLINGGCEVWQRGAGGAASIAVAASTTAYTMDRAYLTTGANEACTVSQQAGLVNGSRWCARLQRNNAQTGTTALKWAMPLTTDQVVRLRGLKATISFQCRSGANFSPTSGAFVATLYVGTGAEGKRGAGFTGETNVVSVTTNLGTSSAVTAVTATSGSTVPTNATQGELLFTWTPVGTAGAADYVEVDDIKIEAGSSATPFVRDQFVNELQQCQRFYEKSFDYATAPAQNSGTLNGTMVGRNFSGSTATILAEAFYETRKRVVPTLTVYNPNAASADWRNSGNTATYAYTNVTSGETSFSATATNVGASTNACIHWSADADL